LFFIVFLKIEKVNDNRAMDVEIPGIMDNAKDREILL